MRIPGAIAALLLCCIALACGGSDATPTLVPAGPASESSPGSTLAPPPTAAPSRVATATTSSARPDPSTVTPARNRSPAATASLTLRPATIPPLTAAPTPTPTLAHTSPSPPVPSQGTTPGPTNLAALEEIADVEGRWEGATTLPGLGALDLTVYLSVSQAVLAGKMDIPAQNAFGLELSHVAFDSGDLHLELESPLGLAVGKGQLVDGVVEGQFSQADVRGTFRLQLVEGGLESTAEKVDDASLRRQEVSFTSGDVLLSGDLTLPGGGGPHPSVVLISGSGAQDRDSNFYGFKFFDVLARHIVPLGIAVLRIDDRGVGGSEGNGLETTLRDRADDVTAAVQFLRSREDIYLDRIGLIGHSEGAMVALLAADRTEHVAHATLLAAPILPGEDMLRMQLVAIMVADGATAGEIRQAQLQQEMTLRAVITGEGWEETEAAARRTARQRLKELPGGWQEAIRDVDAYLDAIIRREMRFAHSAWYGSIVEYDPAPLLRRLGVPLLAIYGELDTQVSASVNAAELASALEAAQHPNYTVVTLAGANHLFQESITGSPREYAGLKPEFTNEFLEILSDWLAIQTEGT